MAEQRTPSANKGRTKQRMLDSAVALLRERGIAGVTLDAVLSRSQAPRGSVYHHFPGGRNELILAAAQQAGDYITALVNETSAESDPPTMFDQFVRFWQQTLAETDYLAGCPIAALGLSSHHDTPEAAELVRDIFTRWQTNVSVVLTANGIPHARAERLATVTVAALEGAIILCRAHRNNRPLDDVHTEIAPLLAPETP